MRIVIVIVIGAAQALYTLLRLLPVKRKVVLLSRQSNEPSRDFVMLEQELRHLDPGLEVVVRCRFIERGLAARVGYLGEVLVQMYHLATASACVLDGYIVPVSVLSHRPGLVIVQMWHALGAIKQFGRQALGRPGGREPGIAEAMRMHHNYDVVLCGADIWVPVFAEAFGVPTEAVLPLGLPRVDYLLAASARAAAGSFPPAAMRLRERYTRLRDAAGPVVLYAPTYRRREPTSFDRVIEAFAGGPVTLVVKPHDLETASLEADHVVDASGIDVLDLITLADVVITDYSAVAFEACAAGKPVMFYVSDIDEYSATYGLNLDPVAEMPDAASRDIDEIARRVRAGDFGAESSRAFCARFGPTIDGGCTRRIAGMVLEHISGGERA